MSKLGSYGKKHARFQDTKPYMWPEEDESSWHGVRPLGTSTFGCAGLRVKVDEASNITSVSPYIQTFDFYLKND